MAKSDAWFVVASGVETDAAVAGGRFAGRPVLPVFPGGGPGTDPCGRPCQINLWFISSGRTGLSVRLLAVWEGLRAGLPTPI